MKDTISELKNTVEGVKIRSDEAENQISKLVDKVKNIPTQSNKMKNGSRSSQDGGIGRHTVTPHTTKRRTTI